ncbi:sarcolemmal membrane-associated protein-like isoform X2 [Artemia franciscana]|uniref:sarcolemmal membrane-associated protein-like isoform X2 n=1 Tax=Artemia franciscana TaxID=6661 RepID=UPI0032D9ECAF
MVVHKNGPLPDMGTYSDGIISYESDADTLSDVDNQKEQNKPVPQAILTKKQNSHPFVSTKFTTELNFKERTLNLEWPVKIGRSVARARPAANNGIFDCKVLSRNHALIWYEDSKFFLQDTKSSNGTFVNNQRLSKGAEESVPREIFSGDVIQFGVDVIENSKRVTHGCIVATVKLYHSDGREAKPSEGSNTVGHQQLSEVNQILQEARSREEKLESKLVEIQRILAQTKEASAAGWQALMTEDRLLSRIQHLEDQLAVYVKNQSEDKLKEDVLQMIEERSKYEDAAKESLSRALQEKNDSLRKLEVVERSLANIEEECASLRQLVKTKDVELSDILEKYEQQLKNAESIESKLNETLGKYQDELKEWEDEKSILEKKILELQVGVLPHPDGERGKIEAELILKLDKEKSDENGYLSIEDTDICQNEKKDHESKSEEVEALQKRIRDLENTMDALKTEKESLMSTNEDGEKIPITGNVTSTDDNANLIKQLKDEIGRLQELLADSRESQVKIDLESTALRKELEEAKAESQDAWAAAVRLRQQLRDLSSLLPALSNGSDEEEENEMNHAEEDDSIDSEAARLSARLQQRIMALRMKQAEADDMSRVYESDLSNCKRRLLDAETVVKAQEKLILDLKEKRDAGDEVGTDFLQLREDNTRLEEECAVLRKKVQELIETVGKHEKDLLNFGNEDRKLPQQKDSVPERESTCSLKSEEKDKEDPLLSFSLDSTRRELDELKEQLHTVTAGNFSLLAEYEAVRSELRSYASQPRWVKIGQLLWPFLFIVIVSLFIDLTPLRHFCTS